MRFTSDGQMVTIAKTVKIHDLISNQTTHTLKRDDGKPTTFYSVTPFGNNIICAGDDDGGVFVWDTRTPEEPMFSSYDCEQYISDIDGKFEHRKLLVCTSGEGTLTAYDLRAKKMIEPQSELFEAGFQCVKLVDSNKKVVIGGEDGAIYVFNQNEWAHTSGKFAITSDTQNRGKCSIDSMDMLEDSSIFLFGCSDGRLRAVTLWPHRIMSETILCKRSSLESVHVNPKEDLSQIVVAGENHINIVSYEEKSDDESAEEDQDKTKSIVSANTSDDIKMSNTEDDEASLKRKTKIDTDDYLNVFN